MSFFHCPTRILNALVKNTRSHWCHKIISVRYVSTHKWSRHVDSCLIHSETKKGKKEIKNINTHRKAGDIAFAILIGIFFFLEKSNMNYNRVLTSLKNCDFFFRRFDTMSSLKHIRTWIWIISQDFLSLQQMQHCEKNIYQIKFRAKNKHEYIF